jgi:tripartite ATP-independent transporter DctM subunit
MDYAIVPVSMFGSLIVCLCIGIPVLYAIGIVAVASAFFLWGYTSIFGIITAAIGTMNSWTLLAVPLFTFMSLVLFETGVVEELYDTFYRFTANLRGGLAVCSVFVGTLMGAMTGVVAGTVIALTTLALPQMLKYGYDKKIAMGAVLAGGTLGQLIPPSTVMVVYGTVTGVSVGGLFAGGVSSGLLLAFLYCIYILIRSFLNKNICPAMSKEDRLPFKENLCRLRKVIVPILLVMSVLGSIFGGIATPTEAAAVGSSTALLIALFRKRLTLTALTNALVATAKTTAMVGFIFTSAQFFGQVFVATGGNKFVMSLANLIPFGAYGVLLITMLIIFFLGCFLETIAIVIICAPIFTPLILASGIDPLWFGILFMVNIQTAYLSPPFGMSLYFMKGAVSVESGIVLKDIFGAALPFLALQVLGLFICIAFPILALWGSRILT